jgi:hypothetical protein
MPLVEPGKPVRESKGVVRGFVEEAEPIINLREWQQRLAHRALPK